MTALRIYVAGASAEVDMCAEFIGRLRDAGAVITHDWTPSVLAYRGMADEAMSEVVRMSSVSADLAGVGMAELLWMLVPEGATIGAWVELGYARGRGIPVHVSGPHSRRTIFTEFCTHHEAHEDAFRYLADRATAARAVLTA